MIDRLLLVHIIVLNEQWHIANPLIGNHLDDYAANVY